MNVLERIELIDRIGRELQARMSYSDIDVYLGAYGVDCKNFQPSTNSKWVYVKELLGDKSEELILKIADELELNHNYSSIGTKEATFWKGGHFKLFLSHLASFKVNTSRLQHALKRYAISSFVAHEDIEPSREWQIEIESALHTMDALAAILMPGFKESNWCDQEVGVGVGRNVLIIPIRKGLDPYGFIGKYQGIQASNKSIGQVAEEVYLTLVKSPKTRGRIVAALANAISQSTEIEEALGKVALIRAIEDVSKDVLEKLRSEVEDNSILIGSEKFLEEVNSLFESYSIPILKVGGISPESWDDDIPF